MNKVDFEKAYYVKLGQGGKWEEDSIQKSILRIGWKEVRRLDFENENWECIEKAIRSEFEDQGAATRDFNALKNLMLSDSNILWITFHNSMLWWGKPKGTGVKKDEISNYLEIEGKWKNTDINEKLLYVNKLPGSISKIQGFRGTVCNVSEVNTLRRVICAEASFNYLAVIESKKNLTSNLAALIKELHWKDFELLVDLVFRQSGWKRVSMLGKNMKYVDIELEDAINEYRYQVQVKSGASLQDFEYYVENFDGTSFNRLFFVVHSPDCKLEEYQSVQEDVKLVLPERLAAMVVDAGLIDWVLERAK